MNQQSLYKGHVVTLTPSVSVRKPNHVHGFKYYLVCVENVSHTCHFGLQCLEGIRNTTVVQSSNETRLA
jgi:hypothetical protein